MTARIYQPARNAMQSGQAKDKWVLEFEPESPRQIEPLMGWTSSSDMKSQIKLKFDSKEEASAYAQRNGVAYRLEEPKVATRKTVSYSDNFRYNRQGSWTH
ncbi:MAG: ETC complex I subunit [Roseiarcus sp.]